MRVSVAVLTLLALSLAAAEERAPQKLSDTGLYAAGRPGEIDARNRPFSPQYPLWSDGATKRRWIFLPAGTTIAAASADEWTLPVGTRFWKEFAFGTRKVETRMLWKVAPARWAFATYRWNEEGTEAMLAPESGLPNVVEIAPGKRHSLPSVDDCGACHGSGERAAPLGFTALQLSPDRDPNAIHGEPLAPGMLTLKTLLDERMLAGAGAASRQAPRIATADPQTRAVLGYLLANCGSCHNGRGEIAAMAPVLRPRDLLTDADAVARRLVGAKTKWQVPGVPEDESVALDPHRLERSALLVRMRSRQPSSQMPPLGTVIRDQAALDAMAAWIPRFVRAASQ